jgi:4'-phosphopantetheinyl transferase
MIRETAIPPLPQGEAHLWQARLDSPGILAGRAAKTLSPDERLRASRFVFAQHRHRFTAGRAILRQILSVYLAKDPHDLAFTYGPHGKPALEGHRLRFNAAHTGEILLVALSSEGDLGVDVEEIRPMNELLAIARNHFTEREFNHIASLRGIPRKHAFFTTWVRKEACLKATGSGLAVPLASFEVGASILPGPQIVRLESNGRELRLHLLDLELSPRLRGAIASTESLRNLRIFHWPDSKLADSTEPARLLHPSAGTSPGDFASLTRPDSSSPS